MKIRKVLATGVLTTAALIQAAMPAFAAKQSNGSPVDQPAAHTQFGIVESDKDVSGQVSFEVPLYVTMAAVSKKTKMAVPSKDAYYIENTSPSIKVEDPQNPGTYKEEPTEPIGVTSLEVKGLDGGWSIVAAKDAGWDTEKTKADAGDASHQMTFTLGKHKFKAMSATGNLTIYDNSAKGGGTGNSWRNLDAATQFVDYNAAGFPTDAAGTTSKTKLVSIGTGANRLGIEMDSDIANIKDRGEKATTGVFKVVYTLAALDKYGQPRNAAVYAGDNWKDAGYTEDQNK